MVNLKPFPPTVHVIESYKTPLMRGAYRTYPNRYDKQPRSDRQTVNDSNEVTYDTKKIGNVTVETQRYVRGGRIDVPQINEKNKNDYGTSTENFIAQQMIELRKRNFGE